MVVFWRFGFNWVRLVSFDWFVWLVVFLQRRCVYWMFMLARKRLLARSDVQLDVPCSGGLLLRRLGTRPCGTLVVLGLPAG